MLCFFFLLLNKSLKLLDFKTFFFGAENSLLTIVNALKTYKLCGIQLILYNNYLHF